jgi:hypothetical protein
MEEFFLNHSKISKFYEILVKFYYMLDEVEIHYNVISRSWIRR